MAPVEALEVGAEVAGMEVLHLLGEGAFGRVYAVRAPGHADPLALKIMSLDVADENMHRRFQREAEVIRRLESEYVPAIFDVGTFDEGSPYILMELLKGQTLGDILKAGRMPWRRALALGVQACGALEVAHAAGVLHRDLKPDNIFIVGEGDAEQLKILDFGVATFVSGQTDHHGALTQTSAIVGTPHYMSPEQIRSTNIDVEADIYMLGVVLYECLTAARPFSGENLGDLLGNVLTGQYRPIGQLAPRTPRAITNAVQRAMSLDPKHRFSSARSFGRALAQARAAMSELPPKPTVAPRRIDGEKPTMPATGLDAIPAPMPGAPPEEALLAPDPVTLPTSTAHRGVLAAGALVILAASVSAGYFFTKGDAQATPTHQQPTTQPTRATQPAAEPSMATPMEANDPPIEPLAAPAEEEGNVPLGALPPEPPPEEEPARPRRRRRPETTDETPPPEPETEMETPPEREPVLPPDGLINPFD